MQQDQSTYESAALLGQYCEFHYGSDYWEVPNFPRACVEAVKSVVDDCAEVTALDLGCAVGRSSFELAQVCRQVYGLDYSQAFIDAAQRLLDEKQLEWSVIEEGRITTPREVSLVSLGFDTVTSKLAFGQGDACNLASELTSYDLICAFNLLCRVASPKKFLDTVASRLRPGGIFALTTPATWMESFTPVEAWLGGYYRDGKAVTTFDGLHEAMGARGFNLIADPFEIPFVIRETRRKYQHSTAQFSAWKVV